MSLPNKPLLVSELPRFGFLGRNILKMVAQIACRMNFPKKCLVITGPITREVAGKDCEQVLESENFDPLMHIVPDATLEEADNLTNFIIEVEPDFLVAVGGGKVADVSKWAAKHAEAKSEKTFEIIVVPTTVSHEGFFSPYCFLKVPLAEHSDILVESFIGKARPPVGLVADTQRIESCGFRNIFSGFAHLMSTLTSLWDWKLANRVRGSPFSDFGAALSSVGSDLLDGDDQIPRISSMDQAIRLVMKPLYISGMGMCLSNSIRVAYGSEHLFAEALARLTPSIETLHGERVGLGAIMSAYLQDQDWTRIKNLLRAVGAPVSASDLGIDPEVIVNALMNTHKISPPDIYTVFGEHGLNAHAAKNLALKTGVFS
ncbi:MAG: iron-containing alcohol dehydrogenase [Candidatus Hodarchaeales archaeon]|jgi:glycerol-1-phosphate dehydrogenase [NAD(P)+]